MFCSEHLERAGLYIKRRDGKHFPISSPTEDPVSRDQEPLKFSLKLAPTNSKKSFQCELFSNDMAQKYKFYINILKGQDNWLLFFFFAFYIFFYFFWLLWLYFSDWNGNNFDICP